MKTYTCLLALIFSLLAIDIYPSVIPDCPLHQLEITKIRGVACDSLIDAHQLTGDRIGGSVVVTVRDMAWNTVSGSCRYSEFSKIFQNGISHCNGKNKFKASDRLYKGFDEVGDLFLDLYNNCIQSHHNFRAVFERGKIYFDRGNLDACLIDIEDLIQSGMADDLIKEMRSADFLVTKGQAFLEMGEYEKAIDVLSEVIKKDPINYKAYFHRASAYFETGQFNEALKDYLSCENGKGVLNSSYESTKDFTNALISSICQGAAEAAVDFVPSLCSSAYGLAETIWALHPLNPKALKNSKKLTSACYEMGECVVDYCKNVNWDTVEGCVEQIKELYEKYDQLSDSEKGNLIGYTIGRFGTDVFAGGAAVKSISSFRKLQTANRLCNLESMAISSKSKEVVISSALKHASEREAFFKNVKIHVDRQNKHVPGKHNFQKNGSIFEHNDAQGLIERFAGTGKPVKKSLPGEPNYKEIVDFGEHIGIWKNIDGSSLPTTKGTIHYSKDGAHIVPTHPNSKIH